MSAKLLRNWSAGVLKVAGTQKPFQLRQQQRNFLLSSKPEDSHVKVLNNAFVPRLVFKYNLLKYYMSKLRLLKLRWTWDQNFRECEFKEESKLAAVSLTKILRMRDMEKIERFSTSNLYYQMANQCGSFPDESCIELLRFRTEDIRQVIPINVHLQKILGLKYAVIDVVMVGLRHVADFESSEDLDKMKNALIHMEPELKAQLEDPNSQLPYVFIEIFMRFRRNYSNALMNSNQEMVNNTNRWLVSIYKICRLNIFTAPPAI